MTDTNAFQQHIKAEYDFSGESIILGTAMLNEKPLPETHIKVPLRSFNRHGLIAGAAGTGKTKTIQLLTEALSDKSIPVLLMDLKGDLSGLAAEGEYHRFILERHDKIGIPFEPMPFPVELLTLSKKRGVQLKATVTEFGPLLFSKILGLNDAQSDIIAIIFKYCDDHQLPLLDLKDIKKALNYATKEGKTALEQLYGPIAPTSAGAILRRIVALEQQGAELFFGEPSFEVDDLIRVSDNGLGMISILRLVDIQDRPKLFSTFMLSLLAEIYATFPEQGDTEQPKLVIFIDEAHLIFDQASPALLDQMETIIKLIRSKGVGIFFCTQNPTDIPEAILGQLGMKVQHALRAFTAKDRKIIKLTTENYPISEFYKTDELLTNLGIGEAAITVLDEKGRSTPLTATLLCAPRSRMDVLTEKELDQLEKKSYLTKKYNKDVDRKSAYEILTKKLMDASIETPETKGKALPKYQPDKEKELSWFEEMTKNPMIRQLGNTVMQEVIRGLMGALGMRKSQQKKRYW